MGRLRLRRRGHRRQARSSHELLADEPDGARSTPHFPAKSRIPLATAAVVGNIKSLLRGQLRNIEASGELRELELCSPAAVSLRRRLSAHPGSASSRRNRTTQRLRLEPHRHADRRLAVERLEPRAMLAATDLRITEFLASNDDGLLDADGDASDWIEIYNSGSTPSTSSGMHLTDDDDELDKWTFPAGTIASRRRLPHRLRLEQGRRAGRRRAAHELQDLRRRRVPGPRSPPTASTVIDEYAPDFPAQVEDVSYGRAMQPSGVERRTLIANGAQARAWVPTSSVYDATWRNVGFNDAVFNLVGPTGFGYENNPGDAVNFTAEIGTTVPDDDALALHAHSVHPGDARRHRQADAADALRRRLRRLHQRRAGRRGQRPGNAAVEFAGDDDRTTIAWPSSSSTSTSARSSPSCASARTCWPFTR